jgi:hypothetical protein
MTAVLLLLTLLLVNAAFSRQPTAMRIAAVALVAAGIAWAVTASSSKHADERLPRWPLAHESRIA